MGNTISSLLIKLGIDAAGVKSGAETAKSEVGKLGSSVSSSAAGMTSSFKGVEEHLKSTGIVGKAAGTALGIGMAVVGFQAVQMGADFVSGIFTATAAEDRLVKQTEAVIASTKGAANVGAEYVSTYAHQLQGLTGISDDVVQADENMLLTFTAVKNQVGAGNDIFNQATQAVLDMSQALGEDGKSAAIQLGKALNDPITGATALRRVGVALTQQQQDQIKAFMATGDVMSAQKVILRELSTEFGGSAKAFGDSAEGMRAKFGNAMEDFQKKIGSVLVPILNVVVQGLTFLLDHTEILFPILAGLGAIILSALVPALWAAVTAMFAADAAAAPVSLVMLAIGAAVAAAVWAFNSFPIVREIVGNVFGFIMTLAKGVIGTLLMVGGAVIGVIAAIPGPLQDAAKGAQATLDGMRASVDAWGTQTAASATDAGTGVGTGLSTGVADGIDAGAPVVATATKTLVQQFGTLIAGVQAASKVSGGAAMADMAKGIGSARQAPVDALKTLHDMLKNQLTKTQEIHRLKGELASKDLAAGMKSKDPEVLAQAIATRDMIQARLDELSPIAATAGANAGAALAAALRAKVAAALAGVLADIAKNPAKYGDTMGGATSGHHALGGPITGPSWVGEDGPEIYVPPVNGTILTHADSMAAVSSGGRGGGRGGSGGAPISIVVHNPTPEPASTSIQREMQKLAAFGFAG